MDFDLTKLEKELEWHGIEEINLGMLLYQIWNCSLWDGKTIIPFKITPKAEWTEIEEPFKSGFEIVEFSKTYGEEEGDRTLRFVLKTTSKDYFEFLVKLSSWEGPMHDGPTPVYPKQAIIYVKKEDY